jgi:HEAT repeat protein
MKKKSFLVFFIPIFCFFWSFAVFSCNETKISKISGQEISARSLVGQARQIIRKALSDDNPRLRTNAIEAVSTAGVMDLMPKVEQLLTDEFVPVRFSAALAIGDTRFSSAKRQLLTLLKSSEENTRMAAAYALYKLGDKEQLKTIGDFISSNDLQVRANAALLLGKCGSRESLKLLYAALSAKDSDDKIRFQCVESIARLGDEKIYPKLWTMIINVNADDRVFGAMSMGALGTEQAKGALTSTLSDEVLEVRLAAAQQLGKLGLSTGEPEVSAVFTQNLTAKMDETDAERVNNLAALAIGQIKTTELVKFLPKLLDNKSKFVQVAAATAVFQCQVTR